MKRDEPPGSGPLSSSPTTNHSREVGAASYALGWIDTAMALEAENTELRRMMSALLVAIARNRELVEYARCELTTVVETEAKAA